MNRLKTFLGFLGAAINIKKALKSPHELDEEKYLSLVTDFELSKAAVGKIADVITPSDWEDLMYDLAVELGEPRTKKSAEKVASYVAHWITVGDEKLKELADILDSEGGNA